MSRSTPSFKRLTKQNPDHVRACQALLGSETTLRACPTLRKTQRGRAVSHRFRTMTKRNTTAAGYGAEHQRARKAAAARHNPSDLCARCSKPLGPMGRWLHYDHNGTRTGYLGFSHARCNSVAGAREGRRRQQPQRPRAQSRAW